MRLAPSGASGNDAAYVAVLRPRGVKPLVRRPIRLLIAQDQALYREALRRAVECESDLEVVAEAADGRLAVAEAERLRPDVAVVDTALPAFDGVRTTCLIKEKAPDCRVLVLADEEDQSLLAGGLGCGASGYLTKGSSVSDLIDAVRALHRGETLIPQPMLGPLLTDLFGRRREHDEALWKVSQLSRREREVLSLLARGSKTAEIAQALVISPETTRTHVQNVLGKLGVHSRLEAATFIVENGLLDDLGRIDGVPAPARKAG